MVEETVCARALRLWSLGQYPFEQVLRTLVAAGPSEAECALTAFNLDFAKAIAANARSGALEEAASVADTFLHDDGFPSQAADKIGKKIRRLANGIQKAGGA